jgi:hypothetical protein
VGRTGRHPVDDYPEDTPMLKRLTKRALAGTTLMLAVTLAGCAAETDSPDAAAPNGAASKSAPSSVPADAEPLLAEHGLAGMDTVEIIDHLDRLGGAERPTDMMASVRPGELVVSAGSEEFSLGIPADRFYLSVAPYVDQTHECFYHSLTTCQGELTGKDVEVKIVDAATGEVLVDQTRTTFCTSPDRRGAPRAGSSHGCVE